MPNRVVILLVILLMVNTAMSQAPATPNLGAQRAAMKKLDFLVGKWSGAGLMYRGAETVEFSQTEDARYYLDGLLLVIEGAGKRKSDGNLVLQAFGVASYDDSTGTYHMRAFNDGRWLDTEVKLSGDKELTWGFVFGEYRTHSVLRINEKGEWTELHQLTHGSEPPRKLMEITVRPQH